MINKKNSPRIAAVKYLLVVPVLTAVLLLLQMSGLQAAEEYLSEKGSIVNENPVWEEALPVTENNVSNHPAETATKPETVVTKEIVIIPELSTEQYPDSVKLVLRGIKEGDEPLLILYVKIIPNEELHKIDPKIIESIEVLKSVNLYGEKAADGVSIITTKTGMQSGIPQDPIKPETIPDYRTRQGTTYAPEGNDIPNVTLSSGDLKINVYTIGSGEQKINARSRLGNEPLIIVDGKEVKSDSLGNISAGDIESISVLKEQSAITKYGEKGKNGVILITTKK